jgi:hypothetical protein
LKFKIYKTLIIENELVEAGLILPYVAGYLMTPGSGAKFSIY